MMFWWLGTALAGVPLALTLDDLPWVGPTLRGESRTEAVAATAAHLTGLPVTGFVICEGGTAAELQPWVDAGLAVGNHSAHHADLNETPPEQWLAQVASCQQELARRGLDTPWFRYPYLHTGTERTTRERVAAELRALGLRRAPVSIDTSDWLLAGPYAAAVNAGDTARAEQVAEVYLQHLRLAARHYRQLSEERVGRQIAQVLLLHANALARDQLPAVLTLLTEEGFDLVPLEQALADEVYSRTDDWVDPVGASWLLRVAPADKPGFGWDQGQEHAMSARLGLSSAPDGFHRIGPYLGVQAISETAWRVTDREGVPANALVVATPQGSTVLVDTPMTPGGTEDLLDWMTLRFGALPVLATVSHHHLDGAAGAGVLQERGVRTLISGQTAALLATRGEALRATLEKQLGAAFSGWTVPELEGSFEASRGWRGVVDGLRVEVLHPGPSHSVDHVMTWFPEQRLLYGGCAVKGGRDLGWTKDADLSAWPDALRTLQALDPVVVVPGHGERLDPGQLSHTLELLADLPQSQDAR